MARKKKIYIAGKMRGLDEATSRALFAEAQKRLESDGFEVVNPWDLNDERIRQGKSLDWGDNVIEDLQELKTCDGILMLQNSNDSSGAQVERHFAQGHGIQIAYDGNSADYVNYYATVNSEHYEHEED